MRLKPGRHSLSLTRHANNGDAGPSPTVPQPANLQSSISKPSAPISSTTLSATFIFLGGGLGALARWLLSSGVQALAASTPLHRFPLGILACNLLGCFAIGAAFGWFAPKDPPAWFFPFAVTGFLGGFTTFSTFGKDTHQLLTDGFTALAAANLAVSALGGLALVALGFRLAAS